MEYLILGLAVVVIIVALSYFSNLVKKPKKGQGGHAKSKAGASSNANPGFVTCPVCNTPLAKGQNLISKVYRPMDVPDQRCTINGCPHCYPRPEPGIRRQCPCCKKEIPLNGYLIARLFNYKNNKKHVMVTGCSECCKK
ncbi:MAG: hypothetical protein K6E69_04825 [Treponema sp.]|uniref:hypothetical protein n=1 Tax=Treponema sp. TaxID=166 RepID=UPI00298E5BC9|nr:hypothetical protein [Treponema sp.]MCR5386425.1 hypothetical protein [Treponema sp.]